MASHCPKPSIRGHRYLDLEKLSRIDAVSVLSISRAAANLEELAENWRFVLRFAATRHHRRLVLTLFRTTGTSFRARDVTKEINVIKQVFNHFEFKGGGGRKSLSSCQGLPHIRGSQLS